MINSLFLSSYSKEECEIDNIFEQCINMQNIVPLKKFAFTKQDSDLFERRLLYHNMIFGNPQYNYNKRMGFEGGNIFFFKEDSLKYL